MSSLRSLGYKLYRHAHEAILPPQSKSAFKEKGVSSAARRSFHHAQPSVTSPERPHLALSLLTPPHVPRPPPLQTLTPEEFVLAGDYLVKTCPTWSWEAGDPSRAWPFLPPAKQYLITHNGKPSLLYLI
jgi:hypothetical protein